MNSLHRLTLSPTRKIALATLTAAWALDLGYGIFVLKGLSLIKITLLLLSFTLALSDKKSGAIGCAVVSFLMVLFSAGTAATLSQQPPSSHLMVTLVSLALFLITTLAMGVAAIKQGKQVIGDR